MIPLLDLATFPANQCPDDSYLSEPVELSLVDRHRLVGDLFEFNGPRNYLVIQLRKNGKRVKVEFARIKIVRFTGAISHKATDKHTFPGEILFNDGSEWSGEVVYYLNDRYGLHLLGLVDGEVFRFFFPGESIQDQQVNELFGQLLISNAGLSHDDLDAALELQKKLRLEDNPEVSSRLGQILQRNGKLTERDIQETLAEHLGLEFLSLKEEIPDQSAVELLPEELARQLGVIPVSRGENYIRIAMVDPRSTEALNMVSFVTGLVPEPVLTTQSDVDWALEVYFRQPEDAEAADTRKLEAPTVEEAKRRGSEAPMVRLVSHIFSQAIKRGTSDIHIRPNEKDVELIFRIDGVMTLIKEFSPSILPGLVSRIKIIGGMNISEHRLPQDGQTRFVEDGAVIDMRISIIPTVDGESVVIRLLNTKYGPLNIDQLGFTSAQKDVFSSNLDKSHGLILVTGPTGSGKSTTLYAALDILRKKNLSIITIENPVEFHIPGIDQVQVNTQVGLTFARVLRNVLRHDPEVIMVGEIRDQETAQISIQSAMTGHLVLSTLHTNSAIGSISRLLDMGAEPYILAPTLLCIVAQRLLKKICTRCATQDDVEAAIRRELNLDVDEVFYRGRGCDHCNNTGRKGRIGTYEVLSLSHELREAIVDGKSEADLMEIALQVGMSPLLDNAIALARSGTINLDEVYAIATDI